MAKQSFKFKMTLGDKISGKAQELVLIQGERKVLSDDNHSYIVTLHGIKMNRKIYQPCEIEAELDFMQVLPGEINPETDKLAVLPTTVPKFSEVSALLLQRIVTLEIIEIVTSSAGTQTGNSCTLAKNYYIYEINPQLKRDTFGLKMYVKLNIFSMDKLMTLTKYSKAYVAKKFGISILKTESEHFGQKPNSEEPLIETNIEGMQYLVYKKKAAYKNNPCNLTSEFIHPYLVQYNESFYDFLVRTSNRCGEFLFFEDGCLTLGLPNASEPYDPDKCLVISDFQSVTMTDIAPETITAGCYSRDSMKDDPDSVGYLNHTATKTNEMGYPKDIFPEHPSSNAELAHDEYLFPLYANKFRTVEWNLWCEGDKSSQALAWLMPYTKLLLGSKINTGKVYINAPLWVLLSAAITWGIPRWFPATNNANSANKAGYKKHLEPYDNPGKEQFNGEKVVQFGTLDKSGWTTIDYYNDIHKFEAEQQKQTICINMGTAFVDVKLGQRIKVSGLDDTYIVIQIEQTSEEQWGRNYEKYDSDSNDMLSGLRSLKIYAIPAYVDLENNRLKYYPPVQRVPIIRKVGPQTAFIADNQDPKWQGRVRIIYPWQSFNKVKLSKLEESVSLLKEDEEKQKRLHHQGEDLNAIMVQQNAIVDQLVAYCQMSKAEREEQMKAIQAELDEQKTSIEKIKSEKKETENTHKHLSEKKEPTKVEEHKLFNLETKLNELKEKQEEAEKKLHDKENLKNEMIRAARYHDENARNPEYKLDTNNTVVESHKTQYQNACNDLKKTKAEQQNVQKNIEVRTKNNEELEKNVEDEINRIASPWVRVASPMATANNAGTFFKPRPGDEVLINYDSDNVERPYVVGSLYSKNHLVPEEKLSRFSSTNLLVKDVSMALQSPNGHHIAFNDPTGGSSFIANALSPGIGYWSKMLLATDDLKSGESFKTLSGGIHIGDTYGIYELDMNSAKRQITINSPFGSVNINAFTGITLDAPNGDIKIVGKNISLEAGNRISITSGTNIGETAWGKDKGIWEAADIFEGDALGALWEELVGKITDFSLIRHIYEVFLRPIDGTLIMKSKRYLKLEAGHGKATIKRDRYSVDASSDQDAKPFFQALVDVCQYIDQRVEEFYTAYYAEYRKTIIQCEAFGRITPNLDPGVYEDMDKILQKGKLSEGDLLTADDLANILREGVVLSDEKKENILSTINAFLKQFMQFMNVRDSFVSDFFPKDYPKFIEYPCMGNIKSFHIFKEISGDKTWSLDDFMMGETDGDENFAEAKKTAIKRKIILFFLSGVGNDKTNKFLTFNLRNFSDMRSDEDLSTEHWWHRMLDKMDKGKFLQNYFIRTFLESTFVASGKKAKDTFLNPQNNERVTWLDDKDGQILFSESPNSTLHFEDGKMKSEDSNQGTIDYLKLKLWNIK